MHSSGRLLEFQNNILTIWLAIFSVCCMDFSVNAGEFFSNLSLFLFPLGDLTRLPVQAVDRALLVDILPRAEQAKGSAWAAIMLGIGSVCGFFL
jgi:solute carrier family 45 protein 1/2/4